MLGPGEAELLEQLLVHVGNLVDRPTLAGGQRHHAVVEALDDDVAGFVLHRGNQLGQRHRRIGDEVAVVPAVQVAGGAVDRDLRAGHAARTVKHGWQATRMARTVNDNGEVRTNRSGIGRHRRREVR